VPAHATQEALVAAFSRLNSFRGDAAFKTWLYRIATNKALDMGRRRSVRASTTVLAAEIEGETPLPGAWTPPAARADPERELVRKSEADRLWQLVDSLPSDYRIVLLLFYRQGLSYEASVLKLPKRTVETRLYRARKKLRDAWVSDTTGGERV